MESSSVFANIVRAPEDPILGVRIDFFLSTNPSPFLVTYLLCVRSRSHRSLSYFFSILSFTREAGFADANLFAWVD